MRKAPENTKRGAAKVQTVMHEWGKGELRSGSKTGPVVKSQDQAPGISRHSSLLSMVWKV